MAVFTLHDVLKIAQRNEAKIVQMQAKIDLMQSMITKEDKLAVPEKVEKIDEKIGDNATTPQENMSTIGLSKPSEPKPKAFKSRSKRREI